MVWSGDWYAYPGPRIPGHGIRAKTGRGVKFGQTWWGDRWIAALERLVDPGRLTRGRTYARAGQVLNLDLAPGSVAARVQGSRPTPYAVRIRLPLLPDDAWERVIDAMAGQAIFAAKLLAGEMPRDIEDAFTAAGVELFPSARDDLDTSCSCPDWSNPCKHVAAVYYLLGEQFDEDPFLLFRLRGRDRAEVVRELRERRALGSGLPPVEPAPLTAPAALPDEPAVPLEECLDAFWAGGPDEDLFRTDVTPPERDAEPLRRLGTPPFWDSDREFLPLMGSLYAAISRAARAAILGT